MSQDTIRYLGFMDKLICESIDLYPDTSFKWTSEYDLKWSKYGYFSINGDTLQLDFYKTIKDKRANLIITKTSRYLTVDNKMYLLNDKGRAIKKMKDKSFRTKWSWVSFGRHKYYFLRQN